MFYLFLIIVKKHMFVYFNETNLDHFLLTDQSVISSDASCKDIDNDNVEDIVVFLV